MQWSTTVSLHDLHIIDDANSIVRWHRMSQCPVCLQPIPYDERRLIAGKVLHSGCIICVECHKSIGEGAFEQHDDNIFCVSCYNSTIKIKKESSPTSITTTTTTTTTIITEDNDTSTSSAARYGSMKSFIERVYLYNEYNQKKTSHLNIIE
ncbi:unnamed protein product, partial [Rotaria magnacalcarata]